MARKRPENFRSWKPGDVTVDVSELKIYHEPCPGCRPALAKADYRVANRPQDTRMGSRIRGKPLFESEEADEAYHDAEYDLAEGHEGGKQHRLHEAEYDSAADFVSVEDFAEFAAEVFKALDRDADGDPEDENEEKEYDQRGPRGTGGIPQFAAKGIRDLYRDTHRRLDVIEAQMRSQGLSKQLSLAKSMSPSRGGDADLLAAADRWARSRGA